MQVSSAAISVFSPPVALWPVLTTWNHRKSPPEPNCRVQASGESPQNPLRERCPRSAASQRRHQLHTAFFFDPNLGEPRWNLPVLLLWLISTVAHPRSRYIARRRCTAAAAAP